MDSCPIVSQRERKCNASEEELLTVEIEMLMAKNVIEKVYISEPGEVILPVFLTPKPDGSQRMILNLKKFNNHVTYHHFKMETLHTITDVMQHGCLMASLDIKDAYYSVRIAKGHRKYFRCRFKGNLYQYTALPNGLASCPRIFTKLLKPALTVLHKQGIVVMAYIDDIYIQGIDLHMCLSNVIRAITVFTELGFVIHPDKSSFIPAQEIKMLGFNLKSNAMMVTPTQHKIESVVAICKRLLSSQENTIRYVAKAVATIISCFPGVLYGPLYYRHLEQTKSEALKESKGNFDVVMSLLANAKLEVNWWIANIGNASKPISRENPKHEINTDASLQGWGAFHNNTCTGGTWSASEKQSSINFLEMKAILFALKVFAKDYHNTHIKILSDNTTAVCVLNNMGTSHSQMCNEMCKEILEWCINRKIWLTLAYIPSKDNTEADIASRKQGNISSEWQLWPTFLKGCIDQLKFYPNIDLFATRINKQFPCFVSFKPDPEAFAIDAFTIDWSTYTFYAFPPFSIISRVLRKIQDDNAMGLCVFPNRPTQPWFPRAMRMMVKSSIIIKASQNSLFLPTKPEEKHPLFKKLQLIVCLLSAKN